MSVNTSKDFINWLWLGVGVFLPSLFICWQISQTSFNFDTEAAKIVNKTAWQWAFGEHKQWYVWVNIGVLIFPFLLSFDKRVAFYKSWKYALPAVLANAIFFTPWDVWYTRLGVWGFNNRYFEGTYFGLPLGEYLFFLTVPYACLFVHACLCEYIKTDLLAAWDKLITWSLLLVLFGVGGYYYDKIYTAWAFLLPAGLLLVHYLCVPNTYRTRFYLSYLVCLFPFLLTNGILTGAFNQEPVVIYNDVHNLSSVLGTRCITIPYDDFAYGFLLLFIPILIFEEAKRNQKKLHPTHTQPNV